MSTITMQARIGMRPDGTRTRPAGSGRPDRGSARRSAPNGRGRSGVAAPELVRPGGPVALAPAGCRGEARPQAQVQLPRVRTVAPSRLRLTDRGIAVVLVAGAMVMVAALTVVGATALRVTSDHYQPAVIAAAR